MPFARKNIEKVTPYQAGKPIDETKRELKLREVIKLASNENPFGTSPKAISAMTKALREVNRYPDSHSFYLKKRLARTHAVTPEQLLMGNGSDEIIDIIIKTFVEADETIITAETTFLEYEIIASVYGRKVIKVPLRYFSYDLDAIRGKIDKKTKLVFIANPNNPTGTYVSESKLKDFLRKVPKHVIVVLDEAYDTFIDVTDFPSTVKYLRNNNLIVLKTFSKAYGLAGLRVGYAMARQEFISYMERARQPFNVNALAQAAALAALDDKVFLQKSRKQVIEGKRYLYTQLKKMNLAYVPSVANFILVDVRQDAQDVFKRMLKMGVIVRDMKQYGLRKFIRVTVGKKKENERFIKALSKVVIDRRAK